MQYLYWREVQPDQSGVTGKLYYKCSIEVSLVYVGINSLV